MNEKFLTSSRLIFRERTLLLMDKVMRSNIDDQLRFFGCLTHAELTPLINKTIAHLKERPNDKLLFDLLLKSNNEVIGNIGFHNWNRDQNRAEIGYMLHERFRNKKYMSEAVPIVLNYGFERMNLRRIEAQVGIDNRPSIKLIQSNSFQLEGCLRQNYFHNNKFHDSFVFSKLKNREN